MNNVLSIATDVAKKTALMLLTWLGMYLLWIWCGYIIGLIEGSVLLQVLNHDADAVMATVNNIMIFDLIAAGVLPMVLGIKITTNIWK